MFSMIIFAAAAAAHPIPDAKACAAAVHDDLPQAVTACDTTGVQVDIFKPGGLSDACINAMDTGKKSGQMAPKLNAVMRKALIDNFDKDMDACLNPTPASHPPVRKAVNLWD